jgi:UDP-N-acetylglucosamine:LPS N-acetylglucosamine transferase
MIFSNARELIQTIEQTENLIQENAPEQMLVIGMGNLGRIVERVCSRKHVPCLVRGRWTPLFVCNKVNEIRGTVGWSGWFFLKRFAEFRRKRLLTARTTVKADRPRILLLSPSINWRSVWSYDSGKQEARDVLMGRVIAEVKRRGYSALCVDINYSNRSGVKLLRNKTEKSADTWVPFEHYRDRDALAEPQIKSDLAALRDAYTTISRSDAFKRALEYHNISLWDFLNRIFKQQFSYLRSLHFARALEAAREMIRIEQPDAVIMTFETDYYAKATIIAAQEAGVPTLAIQHGFITPENVEYMYRKVTPVRGEDGCPIPTITAVGGTETADLLTRSGSYPLNSVVVTGFPKHDDLVNIERNETSRAILRSIGLSLDKKTIILVSGGFHAKYGWTREYDREILELILDLLSRRQDIQLILRLHPMEDGRLQREIIKKRGQERAAIVKGEENRLLWASDVFVTVNSALALEALILGKPVLTFNLSGKEIPAIDLGLATVKFDLESLQTQIETALDRKPEPTKLDTIRNEIERHANTVDGRSSARICDLLTNLIQRKSPARSTP